MYKPMYVKSQYPGRLEIREDLEAMAKKLRVKRMQEVREQERQLALARNQEYRDKINQRKEKKMILAKDVKREEVVQKRDQVAAQWQCSLAKTGEAHRTARWSTQETIERRITTETTTIEQRLHAEARQKEAMDIIRTKRAEAQQRINDMLYLKHLRDDAKQEEREDAHARRETQEIKDRLNRPQPIVHNTHYFHQVVQSAERVDHRFPIKIQAKVIRHGLVANDDTVYNDAKIQETVTIKNNWDHIMTEMQQKKAVKKRAIVAKSVAIKQRGSQNLEDQLKVLSVVDRAGGRLHRVKEIHQISKDEDNMKVKDAFEKLFMVSAIPQAEDGAIASMPLLPPSPPQMRSQMRPHEMAISRSPMSPYDALYGGDESSTTSYSSASVMEDSLFDASKLSTSNIFHAAADYSTDEESLSPDASHILPADWRNVEGIKPAVVVAHDELEESFDTNPEMEDSREEVEIVHDVDSLNLSQAAPESPGYLSESSPFAKIRDHRAIASSTAGSANAGAAVMIHQVPEVTQNSGAIQFNDSSLSEEAAKAELVTSSDSDVNHTTLTELLARAETLTSSSGGSKSGEEKNMQSVSKANIRPLTTFYDTMDLTIKQTNYLDDDNQSISSLGSNSTAAEEASTASEVVRSFEKDIGKGISMSQSSSSVSSIAFAEDHNEDGVIASANQANTSMSQESDSSTNRLLTEWEKRYNLVQETKQSPPKVEDRILREQERIQREYLDEQLRIRKLQEERERRTQLQQQELARQRQELMERMQSLGQASSPVRSSPPKSQPQPAVESPEDNMSTSSTLSSDAFFQANIPSSLLRDDGDDQGSTASSASSISLSVHLTSNVMSPAKQPQPHQTVTTTTAVTSEQSTSNNKMKTHFANDLTSHILNEVSSEIEADLVEESSSQSSTSFSGISSTFLSQSQPTSSTLQVSDTFTRTTGALPPTSRQALPSPMKDDRRYNTSGLFSDESSNMDLQSEGYSHAGSTLTEIQQEILEMRRRLMMAVSYPNPSAIPTITANPYTRSTTAMSAATTTSANMMEHSTTNYTNFTNTYNSTMTNLDVLGSALRTYPNSSVFHDSSDDSSDAIVYGQKRETIPGTALSSSGLRPPTTTTSQQPQDVSMDSLQEGSLSSEDYKTSPTPPSHTIYSSSTANVVNLTTQSSSSSALNIRATTTTSSTNNMNATYRASYSTNRNTVPTIASTTYTTRRSLDDTSLSTGSLHSGEYDDDYLRSSMQSQVSRGYSSSVARTSNAQTGYDATSTPSEDTLSNYPIDSSYSLTGSKSQLTPLSHSESSPSKLYSTGGTLDATPTQFYQIHEESDENEDSDEDRMANDDDLSHQSSLA